MEWNFDEAVSYYRKQGAPKDQTALVGLLKEIQQEHGGSIPEFYLEQIVENYAIKQTHLQAIIKRMPTLRLRNVHILEICAGPNCRKHRDLAAAAEKMYLSSGKRFTLLFTPCKRMCGKGPNLKWDGTVYHKANQALLEQLLKNAGIEI